MKKIFLHIIRRFKYSGVFLRQSWVAFPFSSFYKFVRLLRGCSVSDYLAEFQKTLVSKMESQSSIKHALRGYTNIWLRFHFFSENLHLTIIKKW